MNYKELQISRSEQKWGAKTFKVYTLENLRNQIEFLCTNYKIPKSIICLGIRNGNEYDFFKDNKFTKDSEVFGIDINPMVGGVGYNCYCYDFSKLPSNYKESFDLVYSNSLDHAEDLDKTLKEWYRISRDYILISFQNKNVKTNIVDIHNFDLDKIKTLTEPYFRILKVWEYKDNIAVLFNKK